MGSPWDGGAISERYLPVLARTDIFRWFGRTGIRTRLTIGIAAYTVVTLMAFHALNTSGEFHSRPSRMAADNVLPGLRRPGELRGGRTCTEKCECACPTLWDKAQDLLARMTTMSPQESDKEETLPEKRHSRSEKKLDLAPFTELLDKYNFTASESYNFSDCYGQYADLMEDLIEKEGTPWMEDLQRSRQKHCKRILLVVVFNRPYYSSIKFLRRIYAPIFHDRILFVADQDHPSHPGVFRTNLGFDEKSGFFQHLALSEVMTLWPDYDGYLFVGDDMAVNPHRMMEDMDPDKLWTTRFSFMTSIVDPTEAILRWFHWHEEWGVKSIIKALPCLPWDTFERWARGYVIECKHCVVIHAADIGYIPRRFANDFRHWSYLLRETMNEIALHQIVFAVANNKSDVQILEGKYAWDAQRLHVAKYLEDDTNNFVHPVKFSNLSLQAYVEDWLENRAKKRRKKGWTIC